jgi:hypothetical protein
VGGLCGFVAAADEREGRRGAESEMAEQGFPRRDEDITEVQLRHAPPPLLAPPPSTRPFRPPPAAAPGQQPFAPRPPATAPGPPPFDPRPTQVTQAFDPQTTQVAPPYVAPPGQPPSDPQFGPRRGSPTDPALDASWSWKATAITLVVLAVVGGASFWWFTRDVPTAIAVDGKPIANASAVLDGAEQAFADLVESDGATPAEGAGCWFAPPEDEASATLGPRIACGPVLLGVSGTTKPWVIGRAQYQLGTGGDDVTGTFQAFEAVEDLDVGELAHPDGKDVPGTSDLQPATGGLRAADGRRLLGDQEAIDGADDAFATAAEEAGASVSDDSLCFFGGTKGKADAFVADGSIWCGPVLVRGSDPSDLWATTSFSPTSGESFALATATAPTSFSLSSTTSLAPGVDLYRPDGKEVPEGLDLEVPDAAPIEDGEVQIVEQLPDDVDLTEPADGRLATPARSLRFTGLGKAEQIGAGADALVAAEGDILVVASFEATATEGGGFDQGTAVLSVDGDKSPFDRWSSVDGSGALVAPVPDDAEDVTLEVLFDGVTQEISLVTGERTPGFPAALYREKPSLGLQAQISAQAPMPVGDPATATGVASEVRLAAWIEGRGWAPDGKAYLVLTVTGWSAPPPCCEVTGAEVVGEFRLTPTGGTPTDALASDTPASTPEPVFEVPADFTSGTLEIRLLVSFERDGRTDNTAGEPVQVDIEVPA